MQLTSNFTLTELTVTRSGLNNQPTGVELANITATAELMEEVRTTLCNRPIKVSSGYRSKAVNRSVGGAAKSAHLHGYAVDFTCPKFGTPTQIADALAASDIPFDQVIDEGAWVHISFDPRQRRQHLAATFKDGKATYVRR